MLYIPYDQDKDSELVAELQRDLSWFDTLYPAREPSSHRQFNPQDPDEVHRDCHCSLPGAEDPLSGTQDGQEWKLTDCFVYCFVNWIHYNLKYTFFLIILPLSSSFLILYYSPGFYFL